MSAIKIVTGGFIWYEVEEFKRKIKIGQQIEIQRKSISGERGREVCRVERKLRYLLVLKPERKIDFLGIQETFTVSYIELMCMRRANESKKILKQSA